jgi:hypothetical protein
MLVETCQHRRCEWRGECCVMFSVGIVRRLSRIVTEMRRLCFVYWIGVASFIEVTYRVIRFQGRSCSTCSTEGNKFGVSKREQRSLDVGCVIVSFTFKFRLYRSSETGRTWLFVLFRLLFCHSTKWMYVERTFRAAKNLFMFVHRHCLFLGVC